MGSSAVARCAILLTEGQAKGTGIDGARVMKPRGD